MIAIISWGNHCRLMKLKNCKDWAAMARFLKILPKTDEASKSGWWWGSVACKCMNELKKGRAMFEQTAEKWQGNNEGVLLCYWIDVTANIGKSKRVCICEGMSTMNGVDEQWNVLTASFVLCSYRWAVNRGNCSTRLCNKTPKAV